ncbi:heterokaryon incompatibility protein-domain-containing protein [Podospora australis]|uniref:Heterokaryon incompatibility protein-domain-containing protein n=1 Tax=Podospora australis TaxID=1536484 RepID=A0AAN6WMX8_9PEZI|nr:heterokaryon incompatibility protein-domain-containing protein [Podospora australis]
MSRRIWEHIEDTLETLVFGSRSPNQHPRTEIATPAPPDRIRNDNVSPNPYNYTPLPADNTTKSIRLLELLPGSRQDDICCNLTSIPLHSQLQYEALSYVWGDTTELSPIQINNDSQLMITSNLRTALLNIRQPNTSRRLWIDAVCIDQNNVQERNHQVSLMSEIYRTASRTLVWLGNNHPVHTIKACFLVETLADEAISLQEQQDANLTLGSGDQLHQQQSDLSLPLLDTVAIADESPLYQRFKNDFSALHLACAEWWFRTWTVQEILLASKAVVVCGKYTLDWDRLCYAVDYGLTLGIWNPVVLGIIVDPIMTPYLSLRAMRRQKQLRQNMASSFPTESVPNDTATAETAANTLLDLLIQSRFRQATDPRDKVYGLLGLLSPEATNALGMVPDYTLSTEAVYTHTARQLLLHSGGSLRLLGSAGQTPTSGSSTIISLSLPSWVSDWRNATAPFCPVPLTNDARGFPRQTHASAPLDPEDCSLLLGKTTSNRDVLRLTGHHLTTITSVAPVLHRLRRDGFASTKVLEQQSTLVERLAALGQVFKGVVKAYAEVSSVVPHLATFWDWEAFFREEGPPEVQNLRWDGASVPKQGEIQRQCEDGERGGGGYDPLFVYWQTLCVGTMAPRGEDTQQLFYSWRASLKAIFSWREWGVDSLFRPLAFVGYLMKTWNEYNRFACLLEGVYERRLGRGENKMLVLLPGEAQVGDQIFLVKGGRVPLVFRQRKEGGWIFVGEAYAHGIMDGEGFEERRCGEMEVY